MKYFQSAEKNLKHKLSQIIGSPFKSGIKGSTTYFVKEIESHVTVEVPDNSKAIFERYSKGLLITFFKSNKSSFLAIPFKEILELRLVKGKETVQPHFPSPMWILLRLGLKLDLARYFRLYTSEYRIEETVLLLRTGSIKIIFITNGYTFNGQSVFFSQLEEIPALQIIETNK
ncbi:MAG: hypothetical protein R3206_08865 [Salegentibacter mishustinae]|nr:hypothetical protein [Salegentibacter mishustinae]